MSEVNPADRGEPSLNHQGNNTKGGTARPDLLTYLLLFLALIALLVVFRVAKSILLPFATAVFLAYLLYPAVALLNRLKIPYALSVTLVMGVVLALFFFGGVMITGEVNSFIRDLPSYQKALWDFADKLSANYATLFERLVEIFPNIAPPIPAPISGPGFLAPLFSYIFGFINTVFSLISDLFLIFFMLIFLLADARVFREKLIRAWGQGRQREKMTGVLKQINEGIMGFILIRTAINICLGAAVTAILLILRVDYAYIWGPLTGLLNYIPFFGAPLALIPPVVVLILQRGNVWPVIALVIMYVGIHNLEDNFIAPKLLGKKVNLNALAVLLSLILWGFLWGPIGMILATPITTCFKILCDHIEPLKPVGIMLGGSRIKSAGAS